MATQADVLAEIERRKNRPVTKDDVQAEIERRKQPANTNPFMGGLLDVITGAGEASEIAQTVASGAVAIPASGLAGIASMSPIGDAFDIGVDADERKDIVENVQEQLTIPPITPGATAKLETVQDLIETGINAARIPISKIGEVIELITGRSPEQAAQVASDINEKGFSATLGDSVLEKTGSPLLASIAFAAPQIIPELIGNRLIKTPATDLEIRVADKIKSQTIPEPAVEPGLDVVEQPGVVESLPGEVKQIVEPIAPVDGVGRQLLDGAEIIVDNGAFDAAVKQGWDPVPLALMKGGSQVDKAKYLKMVQILKNNMADPTTAIRTLHSNVLGESVLERFNYVKGVNKRERIRLNEVAKNLEGQSVDVSAPMTEFSGVMDELNVDVKRNNKGKLIVDFKNSDLTSSAHEPIRNVLHKMDRLTQDGKLQGGQMDAFAAHELKKVLDENIDFGKESPGGIKGRAEGALGSFRHNIDEALDINFDDYNQVNTILRDTIVAMKDFQQQAGKSLDLSAPSSKKTIGILMRRPTSNAKSGGPVMDAVDQLDATAKKYGGVFEDNIDAQMLVVQEIGRMFPRVGGTELKSIITKGIETARQSPTERAATIAGHAAEKARGINDANKLKTIEKLLKEQ